MTSFSNKSKLNTWSLYIASTIWIINAFLLLMRSWLSFNLNQSVESAIGLFVFISYFIIFPICAVMAFLAIIMKRGSCINSIGTLILSFPPAAYIIYSTIKLASQQGDL